MTNFVSKSKNIKQSKRKLEDNVTTTGRKKSRIDNDCTFSETSSNLVENFQTSNNKLTSQVDVHSCISIKNEPIDTYDDNRTELQKKIKQELDDSGKTIFSLTRIFMPIKQEDIPLPKIIKIEPLLINDGDENIIPETLTNGHNDDSNEKNDSVVHLRMDVFVKSEYENDSKSSFNFESTSASAENNMLLEDAVQGDMKEISNKQEEISCNENQISIVDNQFLYAIDNENLDLKNHVGNGENKMSIGKNELSIGKNELSIGKNEISIGKNEISIGKKEISIDENLKPLNRKTRRTRFESNQTSSVKRRSARRSTRLEENTEVAKTDDSGVKYGKKFEEGIHSKAAKKNILIKDVSNIIIIPNHKINNHISADLPKTSNTKAKSTGNPKRIAGKYKCTKTDCKYSCTSKTSLTDHTLTAHSSSRPFKCHLCDYETVRVLGLKSHHLKIHNKDPFSCPDCEFKTFKKSEINLHRAIHKQIDNLYADVESISPANALHCSQCDFVAHKRSMLALHEAAHKQVISG